MADSKITALTAISTVDPTADPLVIVDVSDTSMAASGTTKKSTINQLLGAGGTATLASATISGDLTVDTNVLVANASTNTVGIGTTSTDAKFRILDASGNGVRIGFLPGTFNYNLYDATVHEFRAPAGASSFGAITANGIGLGLTPSTSGIGVWFKPVQSASSDANCLDDYEEGTFTPVLTTDSVNFTSVAYIIQEAKYTKIGRLVTISGTIYTSAVVKGLASGNVVITGLPFAQPAGDVLGGGNCNVSEVWLADNPIEFIVSGSSVILLKRATSTGASVNLVVADVGTGTSNFVRFSGQYYV